MNKKILFLTSTRADFGKMKSLIYKAEQEEYLSCHIFVTGMHMLRKYGMTAKEVVDAGFQSIYKYVNQNAQDSMDIILAKTIHGLSDYVKELQPDMIVIHGDRVETMAGAIVGALNNILVAHVEGGEVSGTIDELIRHSVTKMSHIHFVCNDSAKARLVQLGELLSSIFVIGSPDLDVMISSELPNLEETKSRYQIDFKEYALFIYHPVTTDIPNLKENIHNTIEALIESQKNYIVIYPNNDHGTEIILEELKQLHANRRFKIFPSLRFECFLTLLKHSNFMIGNSSAVVREAPFYGLPSINLGSRQNNRAKAKTIIHCREIKSDILSSIQSIENICSEKITEFGRGDSDKRFIAVLRSTATWEISKQKTFVDIST